MGDSTPNERYQKAALQLLAATLDAVAMSDPSWERNDQENPDVNYNRRNLAVYKAVHQALACGFRAGFQVDGETLEWIVAYIDLPTGQVSWHVPSYPEGWDGHSTEEKYERVGEFWDMVNIVKDDEIPAVVPALFIADEDAKTDREEG